MNNVNNGRGRRFLNEGHCVDLMTHGIAHPPFRDSVRCVSGSRVRGRAQYGGRMTGIQWQDQAHNLVGRGVNARKHGVGRGRGGPATRYQSSSRGRMGMGVASRRERSHCNRGEGNPTNGFDGQKPVLQEQLQQKFCWFGNHCKYRYCPYWHEVSGSSCQGWNGSAATIPTYNRWNVLQCHQQSYVSVGRSRSHSRSSFTNSNHRPPLNGGRSQRVFITSDNVGGPQR